MTTTPLRLDRLQEGFITLAETALPGVSVLWDHSEYPRTQAEDQVLTTSLLDGPDNAPTGGSWRQLRMLPLEQTVRILPAAVGQTGESVKLWACGLWWEYQIQVGDTLANIRDGLIAAIDALPLFDAEYTAVDDDEILLEADLGDLFGVEVTGSVPGLIETTVDVEQLAQVHFMPLMSSLRVQAYSMDRYPRSGAAAMLTRLRTFLLTDAAEEIKSRYGLSQVGFNPAAVNLNALAGSKWRSRSAMTVEASQLAVFAQPAKIIEQIRGTLKTRSTAGSAEHETEIEVIP